MGTPTTEALTIAQRALARIEGLAERSQYSEAYAARDELREVVSLLTPLHLLPTTADEPRLP